MDSVAGSSRLVPLPVAGDLDVAGPARLRSYRARGGAVSRKPKRRDILMRRASICVALFGLALLGLAGTASATPTVTLKAEAVPIKGFPHTGNIYGAGAAVKAVINIKGTEYGGF